MGCAQSRHQKPTSTWHRLSKVLYAPDYYTAEQQWPRGGWGHYHNAPPDANFDDQYASMRDLDKLNRLRNHPRRKGTRMRRPEQPPRMYVKKSKPQIRTRDNKTRRISPLHYPTVAEVERSTFWGPPHKVTKHELRRRNQQSGDSMRDVEFRYEDAYSSIAGHRPGEGPKKKARRMPQRIGDRRTIWDALDSALALPPHVRKATPDPRQRTHRQQAKIPQQQLKHDPIAGPHGQSSLRSQQAVNYNTDYVYW